MDKKLSRLIALAAALVFSVMLCVPLMSSAAADPQLTGRLDFAWGVNGHHRGYDAYPERFLEQQIRLAAELGCKIYRFNLNSTTSDELLYLDKVVALSDAYGMELMLVIDRSIGSNEDIHDRFKMVAGRYDGKSGYGRIQYIQVFNEIDVALLNKANPVSTPDGSKIYHYLQNDLNLYLTKFEAAISGIKEGCSTTKSIINFRYLHTGMTDYFLQKGLEWDILGLDWYSNMGSINDILDKMISGYPHDLMICETNIWPVKNGDYDANTTYLPELMRQIYNYSSRIKALIVYQLLDEAAVESAGSFNSDAHFGIIYCDAAGNIGNKKPIYGVIQQMLGGGTVTPEYTNSAPATTATATNTKSAAATRTTSPVNSNTTAPVSSITGNSTGTANDGSSEDADTDDTEEGAGDTGTDQAGDTGTETGGSAGAADQAGTNDGNSKNDFPAVPVIITAAGVFAGGAFLLMKFPLLSTPPKVT